MTRRCTRSLPSGRVTHLGRVATERSRYECFHVTGQRHVLHVNSRFLLQQRFGTVCRVLGVLESFLDVDETIEGQVSCAGSHHASSRIDGRVLAAVAELAHVDDLVQRWRDAPVRKQQPVRVNDARWTDGSVDNITANDTRTHGIGVLVQCSRDDCRPIVAGRRRTRIDIERRQGGQLTRRRVVKSRISL